MSDLRKAAEQALEALESVYGKGKRCEAAINALRQALAQPEQEPVAWMHNFIEGNVITHEPADIGRHPNRWTPLYTAPPKREWVGLTDDEFMAIAQKYSLPTRVGLEYFKDELEDKLEEKNA